MEKNIFHFSYNENDFQFKIENRSEDSKYDIVLKQKWSQIENNNVLRYPVKSQEYKILKGKYGFYVQLNTDRATFRRKPEQIISMIQPFNPDQFNFMKISYQEILFDIGIGDGNDIIAVNISPILWGHCLLLIERFKGLPQIATLYSLQKAVEVLLLSNSKNMRVIFNSLCANASVNHLHWHLYYLDHRMLLETISLQHLTGLIYTLEEYPAKGFCIKLSSFEEKNLKRYISYVYRIISCLHANQIAHNIYITRAKTDSNKKEFDDIRIYIWARTSTYGEKNCEDFTVAACELFGHITVKTVGAYEWMNESHVSQHLENVTNSVFLCAREKILIALQGVEEQNNESTNI